MIVRRIMAWLLFGPTLVWNYLLARVLRARHWWDEVDEGVILGALPFPWDVPALHGLGVSAVVNTCAEYAGPARAYARFGIVQLRIPTVDFTAPALADVEKAVAFVREQRGLGRSVYVHCKAGRARSGTVVLCYLIAAKGLSPQQAQQLILRRRPHAHPRLDQRDVVRQFWSRHQR